MEQSPHFNIVDIVIMVLLLLGLIRGAWKGLSGELSDLISIAAAVFAGCFFYEPLGSYFLMNTRLHETASYLAAFFAALVGAYLLMRVLRLVLRHLMEFSFKGRIERIGGALAGLIHAGVVTTALVLVVGLLPDPTVHRRFVEESVFGNVIYERLGPVYEDFSEKHPALRMPGEKKTTGEVETWPPPNEERRAP